MRYPTALDMARELDACTKLENRVVGASDVAAVMKALFPLEAERDAALLADVSASWDDGGPASMRTSVPRMSAAPELAPEEWKRALPAGLLNDRARKR